MRLTTFPLQILGLIDVATAAGLRMFSVVFSSEKLGFLRDLVGSLLGGLRAFHRGAVRVSEGP